MNIQVDNAQKAKALKSKLKLALPLNKEGNMESIGPVSGIMALAERRGLDCEVVLYNPSDINVGDLLNTPELAAKNEVAYSTDDYNNEPLPSIVGESFEKAIEKHHDQQRLAFEDDRRADAVRQETIDGLVNPSEIETPETSPEDDFWDEPDFDDGGLARIEALYENGRITKGELDYYKANGILPSENPQAAPESLPDRLLTTGEAARIIFGNSRDQAMKKMYQKTLFRKCKAVQMGGKRSKIWWPMSAVIAYKNKLTKRCCGNRVVVPTHSVTNYDMNKKLDA